MADGESLIVMKSTCEGEDLTGKIRIRKVLTILRNYIGISQENLKKWDISNRFGKYQGDLPWQKLKKMLFNRWRDATDDRMRQVLQILAEAIQKEEGIEDEV